jgi:hypothetical protein
MGEYEESMERPEDGGLYPLNAEGTYGRVPKNRNPGRCFHSAVISWLYWHSVADRLLTDRWLTTGA